MISRIGPSLSGVRGLDIFHGDRFLPRTLPWSFSRRIRHGLTDIAANWIDKAVLHLVVDVDKEVRGWWVLVMTVLEDLVEVLHLGHVLVVVLPPHILLEIVDVNPVVAEGDGAVVHEHRVQSVRELLVLGELGGNQLLRVLDVIVDG